MIASHGAGTRQFIQKKAAPKMQGPLTQSGKFYSKQAVNSKANKAIRDSRDKHDNDEKKKSNDDKKKPKLKLPSISNVIPRIQNTATNLFGIPTAQAQTTQPAQPKPKSMIERAYEIVSDPFAVEPRMRGITTGMGLGSKVYKKEGSEEAMLFNTDRPEGGNSISDFVNKPITADQPTGRGPAGETFFNNFNPAKDSPIISKRDFMPDYDKIEQQKDASPSKARKFISEVMRMPKANVSEPIIAGAQTEAPQPEPKPEIPPMTNPENIQTGGGTMRSSFGSGSYGTGKGLNAGLANEPVLDDGTNDYISSLMDYLKGYSGQDDLVNKQIKELIKALNPQYDQAQSMATNEMNKARQEDINRLTGLFASYGTADSEQRAQAEERVMGDYGGKLADLLAKLQTQKAQDISGYKQKGFDMLREIQQSKADAQLRVAQMVQQAKQAQAQRAQQMQPARVRASRGTVASSGKTGRNDIFNWVQDALAQGGSWQEIAAQAKANNIPIYTGGYFDQLMNNANRQGAWR